MSTTRRQQIKEVRWIERRMRQGDEEGFTNAQSMRELGRLEFLRTYGKPLERPFYPPHIERLLDLADRAETRKSYRNAAKLMARFYDALITHGEALQAKQGKETNES